MGLVTITGGAGSSSVLGRSWHKETHLQTRRAFSRERTELPTLTCGRCRNLAPSHCPVALGLSWVWCWGPAAVTASGELANKWCMPDESGCVLQLVGCGICLAASGCFLMASWHLIGLAPGRQVHVRASSGLCVIHREETVSSFP